MRSWTKIQDLLLSFERSSLAGTARNGVCYSNGIETLISYNLRAAALFE